MVRKFTTPVELPADPANPLEAATKQYVDAGDVAGNYGLFAPADHGLLAWTGDPIYAGSTYQPSGNGFLFWSAVKIDSAITCSTVTYTIFTAGATLTSSRNYIALYSTSGALLRQTADQSTIWTATGTKSNAWSAGAVSLAAGIYYVGGFATGTTRPAFVASAATNGSFSPTLFGRTSPLYRNVVNSATVQTAPPSTLPTASALINPVWFGLS